MGKIEGLKAFINPNPNPINITIWNAILVGGLTDTKTLSQQVKIFKSGYGEDKNVMAFDHSDGGGNGRGLSQTFLTFLKNNPFLPIFLFSAGNKKAKALSDNENVNVKELFFIEFYGSDDNVKGINHAIAKGALSSNIFTGGGTGTGKGIIKGSVDSKGIDHFDALRAVGFELKDKV
jgi:hypothetical protein